MASQDEHQRFRQWASIRLAAPSFQLTRAKQQVFEELLNAAAHNHADNLIEDTCGYPKHEFLRYVSESKHLLLHGSRNPSISVFQPIRNSSDTTMFGQQAAVYAASDGIWPVVFAILDRQVYHGMFYNECSRVQLDGQLSTPFYAFIIEAHALRRQPWTDGMIYVLPRASFVPRTPACVDGLTVQCQEWASVSAVQPVAKVAVRPDDFPFLHDFWGFDEQVLLTLMGRYPDVWPFGDLTDPALYPIRPKAWQPDTAR